MTREYDKVQATAIAMQRRGGSFVKTLGQLIPLADAPNRAKLQAAFPEYMKQYRAIAERHDWYLYE